MRVGRVVQYVLEWFPMFYYGSVCFTMVQYGFTMFTMVQYVLEWFIMFYYDLLLYYTYLNMVYSDLRTIGNYQIHKFEFRT